MGTRKHKRGTEPRVRFTFEQEELSEEDAKIAAEYATKHRRLCTRRGISEALKILENVQKLQELPQDLLGLLDVARLDLQRLEAELGEQWK